MEPIAREILKVFFQQPTGQFAYREIERMTGFSIGTVSRYIKALVKEGFVKSKKSANSILVSANLNNSLFIHIKRAYNIEALYSSGLIECLLTALRPDTLVLFGSYSKGEDDEGSDIDIASIHGRVDLPDIRRFEKVLKRKVNIVQIKSPKDSENEFINSLANGIVLAGALEVVQ